MDNPYNNNELESNAAENLKLFYRRLPTHLLVKDFILGEPKCNYEFYLRDLINKSERFRKLSKNEKYRAPLDES